MSKLLQLSQKRYESILENMMEGCQIIGPDWRYLYANKAVCLQGCVKKEELLGKTMMEVYPGIEKTKLFQELSRCFKRKGHCFLENEFVYLDGQKGWFSLNVQPVPEGLFILSIDITERKQVEEALQKNQKDLNHAQAVAKTGSWRIDTQQNKLLWSDEAYNIFGISKKRLLTYEVFLSGVHPDDRKYVDHEWQEALRGRSYDIEHRIIANGKIKWVREKAELEFDKNKKLSGGFGTVQDITERKSAQEKIEHLASFPRLNPNPVLELDAQGKIIFANVGAKNIIKKIGADTQLIDFLPKNIQIMLKALKNKEGKIFKEESLLGDFIFEKTIHLVPESGTLRIYAIDITERKYAEKALIKLNQNLEMRVGERTKELKRQNRALQMLSRCNLALVQAEKDNNLVNDICRLIVEVGKYQLAWVGEIENDQQKKVRISARYGKEKSYLDSARISWSGKTPRGRGPTGRAVRTGKIQLGDFSSPDPTLNFWRKEALKRNLRSSIVLPLLEKKQAFGALTIYSRETDAFRSQKEIKLLKELSDNLAYGLIAIRARKSAREKEEALLESYRHAGLVNRKISVFLELDRLSCNRKSAGKKALREHVLATAVNFSDATFGLLFAYNKAGKGYDLLESTGISSLENKKLQKIHARKFHFLKLTDMENHRIYGAPDIRHKNMFKISASFKYFACLHFHAPDRKTCLGILYLGFGEEKFFSAQDLEFFDAFVLQAKNAMTKAKVLGN